MKRDTISTMCLPSDRDVLRQIEEVRRSLWRDFAGACEPPRHLLRLALNEAEALAWQTPFPDLLFPVLAEEKVTELKHWWERQRAIHRLWAGGHVAFR